MQDRELKSWKEIAHHLGVNVRTAQKWEQERHLPVKRPPGGKGPVHATTIALDEWKTSTTKDHAESWFRWPVAPGVTAEVRFIGAPVTPTTIEVLREYLTLAKNAYEKS